MHLSDRLKGVHERVVAAGAAWQSYLAIIGIPGVVIALIIRFGKPFGWLAQLNLAADIILGLTAACVLALAFFIAAIAWRLFKPLPKEAAPEAIPTLGSIPAVEAQIYNANLLEIEAAVSRLDQSFATLSKRADASSISFLAHVHLLMMQERVSRVRTLGDELSSAPDDKEVNWIDWAVRERQWRTSLADWESIACYYVKDLNKELNAVNLELYLNSYWDKNTRAIPDADSLHLYKTFRIVYTNFNRCNVNSANNAFKTIFEGRA